MVTSSFCRGQTQYVSARGAGATMAPSIPLSSGPGPPGPDPKGCISELTLPAVG